jgi:dihydropyrimidine dehydrogenase (NAD+) subunit PreA
MIEFCGLTLRHRVINASGCFDALAGARVFGDRLFDEFPFSAYVSKTITLAPRDGNPPPRLWESAAGLINSIGLPNRGLRAYLEDDLPALARLPVPLITNVMGSTPEEVGELVAALEDRPQVRAIELNVSCPNVATGLDIGADPKGLAALLEHVRPLSSKPLIVKLTPNTADVAECAAGAEAGGADAVSLINTINSITSVNLDDFAPEPTIDGKGSHGGYCGPAVKPIALSMVSEIARDKDAAGIPISGIGGIATWRDAAEFMALGAANVQVCTAAMTYGFRIVEEMTAGLSRYLDERQMKLGDLVGRAVPNVSDWQYLNLNFVTKARIDQELCIQCGRCHIVCEDASHQAITATKDGLRHFEVVDAECVGCNLCVSVCPVENCITMEQLTTGVDPHTGAPATGFRNWTQHPNNPMRVAEPAE